MELTNDHPNMRIIHRKVALILGQWVSEVTKTSKLRHGEKNCFVLTLKSSADAVSYTHLTLPTKRIV